MQDGGDEHSQVSCIGCNMRRKAGAQTGKLALNDFMVAFSSSLHQPLFQPFAM